MKRFSYLFGIVTATALTVAPASHAAQEGRIRVIHASPDAPAVDVLVNNAVAIEDLQFGTVTGYTALPEGTYSIKVRPANSSGPDVISTQLKIKGGKDYTVAAVNNLAQIQAEVYKDKNTINRDGQAKLRAVHLSPGAPAVDIAVKNGPTLVRNLQYRDESRYVNVNPGTYNLEVRVAGTNQVVYDIPNVQVEAGKIYQAYAIGVVGGNPAFNVKLSTDSAKNMKIVPKKYYNDDDNDDRRSSNSNRRWHWDNE